MLMTRPTTVSTTTVAAMTKNGTVPHHETQLNNTQHVTASIAESAWFTSVSFRALTPRHVSIVSTTWLVSISTSPSKTGIDTPDASRTLRIAVLGERPTKCSA